MSCKGRRGSLGPELLDQVPKTCTNTCTKCRGISDRRQRAAASTRLPFNNNSLEGENKSKDTEQTIQDDQHDTNSSIENCRKRTYEMNDEV